MLRLSLLLLAASSAPTSTSMAPPAPPAAASSSSRAIGLGIDLGTSGARLSAAASTDPHAPQDLRELHAESIKWAAAGDAAAVDSTATCTRTG